MSHASDEPTPPPAGRRTRGLRTRPWAAALAGALFGALAVLATPAGPASAHAVLTATTPGQGSVVSTAPATVRLTFSEPVRVIPGRTQVIAPDGKRINDGDPVGLGAELSIALRRTDRPLGTYLVSYRVISVDSHPIAGSFTFSVGAPSATVPAPAREGAHPVVAVAVPAAKYLGYAGLALVVGPVLMLGVLWPRRLPRRTPLRLVRWGLALLAGSTLAALWLQAPYATGSAPWDVSAVEFGDVLGSRFGAVLLARLAVVAAVAAVLWKALDRGRALRRRAPRGPLLALTALGVAGLVTWPLTGHPAASPWPAVMAAADVVHLASMAVWLGGLVMVGLLLRGPADPRELGLILPAWSRWATLAVYWLVAGGVTQTLVEAGGLRALLETRYGQLVLAKVALLACVLGVAAYSRRLVRRAAAGRPGITEPAAPMDPAAPLEPAAPMEPAAPLEPAAARGPTGVAVAAARPIAVAPAGGTTAPTRRLRRAVAAELAITAVVLAASAVLVQTTPARTAGIEADAAARAEGFSTTLTSPIFSVQMEVFPAHVGPHNTLHAFLYTPQGTPVSAAEWKVTGDLPGRGIEPIDNPVVSIRGNQGIGALNFPIAGQWRLRLTIRISETEQATVTTTISVP